MKLIENISMNGAKLLLALLPGRNVGLCIMQNYQKAAETDRDHMDKKTQTVRTANE
jgi:hypothetical protein